MRISDLKINDVIRLYSHDKSRSVLAIVDEVGGTNKNYGIYFWAKVETETGWKPKISDNWKFVKVNEPFTRKINLKQEEQDMVHEPPHYQFGKFSARVIIELVGKTYKSTSVFYHVGNALKYLMRAPRKNGLQDLKKAKQSVEFAIENWEAEQ
ncbi:DUF3310 domain-containing protein [Staphylococcus hominis]|uniref:DUF3310 domain-containing protein n=1 Tax=Staphylococcus hominis TaxID=1290 RepID=UPI001F5AB940|nr:DUF3310 domain-containing protein [Staphylococcus hominis]MCI2864578.1 DUF3310 domain-containing protein [Staphylococcus hominis]